MKSLSILYYFFLVCKKSILSVMFRIYETGNILVNLLNLIVRGESQMVNNVLTKRNVILSGVALSTIGVTSYVLKSPSRKEKLVAKLSLMKNKVINATKTKEDPIVEKAGHPHPEDIPDNTMVSEGAMYSVQYYDENEK